MSQQRDVTFYVHPLQSALVSAAAWPLKLLEREMETEDSHRPPLWSEVWPISTLGLIKVVATHTSSHCQSGVLLFNIMADFHLSAYTLNVHTHKKRA